MKKIISIILTIIITSISFTQIAYAARGDLRYKITSMNITEDNITFEGWAFIHDTDNYRTVYKVKEGKTTKEIVKRNGGQKVKIIAELDNGTQKSYSNCDNNGECTYSGNYNFFYEMFTRTGGGGTYGDDYLKCYNDGETRNCNGNNQYYYQDMSFKITIPMDDIKGHTVNFKIAAYNNDYGKEHNYNYTPSVKLGVTGDAIDKKVKEVEIKNITTKLDMMASYAQPQYYINDGKKYGTIHYFNWRNKDDNCEKDLGCRFKIVDFNEGGYKNGYKTGSNSTFIEGAKRPGKYVLCITSEKIGNHYYSYDACSNKNDGEYCGSCNGETAAAYESWVNMPSDLSITVIIPSDKKCPLVNPSEGDLYCNDNLTLEAKCSELTVKKNGSRADVEITQTGTISSVLTPNKIYAGGGFNLGIIYYNTIRWECVKGDCDENIEEAMKEKLKSNFQDSINLEGIKFNGKIIDSSQFIKKCEEKGKFENNKTLTTICTFFLTKSTIDKDGKVKYGVGNDLGINNKYYTSLDDKGTYNIELTIKGMDRLTESSTKKDSEENNQSWTGSWKKKFNNCSIEVYSLLAEPTTSKTLKYKPIYRPIDLNNPFPDRNAGVNWYEWYKIPNNKKRLEESYSKLQYQITLDIQTVAKIKNYNSNHNYLDWDGINSDGESNFIDTYFSTKRENLGDGS